MGNLEEPYIEICLSKQHLWLKQGEQLLADYVVSTAENGPGEAKDSECTPRGRHEICAKIGAGCTTDTVFVGRQPTGELYSPELHDRFPDRDWILTRILWLNGLEPERNHGGNVDSRERYIYIHGAPDGVPMGTPGSRGCIRMRNADVISLFEAVTVGSSVTIFE